MSGPLPVDQFPRWGVLGYVLPWKWFVQRARKVGDQHCPGTRNQATVAPDLLKKFRIHYSGW